MFCRGPLTGFLAAQGVGRAWYSSRMFGPRWLKLVHPGKQPEELRASSGPAMLVAVVGQAALTGLLYHIYLEHMGVANCQMAVRAGFLVSSVCALSEVSHVMFAHKPWALFAIDQGFNTAVIIAIGIGIGWFL